MRILTAIISLFVILGLVGGADASLFGAKLPPVKAGTTKKAQAQFGPGMQTCNVNGVEAPGSCDEVEGPGNMMGPGGPGGFGPGGPGPGGMMGPGGPGGFGPDGEEFDEDAMQKQQLKMMFQGVKQGMRGMGQGVKMMKTALKKLAKEGITAPEELTEAMAKADELIAYLGRIKSANDIEDADAFMEKMSEMMDVGPVLQEWGPRMGDLMRMSQMMKEAERRAKQIKKDVKRLKAGAVKSKIDLTELLTELDEAVATLDSALADAKAKTDPEEKLEAVEEFFDQLEGAYETVKLVKGIKNLARLRGEIARRITQSDREVKVLKRKKLDTTELASIVQQAKAKFGELDASLKQKPLDEDLTLSILEELTELGEQFTDTKDELLGTSSALPTIKGEKFSAPKFDFGAFEQFKRAEKTAKPEEEEESEE